MTAPFTSLPADARRSLFVYNLLFPLVFLALLPSFLLRMFRRGNYREHFGQRLGFFTEADRKQLEGRRPLWIRSISVGETLIALKLIKQLHTQDPGQLIVLSVTTSTGYALACEAAADWLMPIYNPIDLLPIVRHALHILQPSRIVLIEGDIWPNFLAETRRRGIPVWLGNARLSPKSERGFRRFKSFAGPIFRLFEGVAATEPEDIARWESLGVTREKIQITGNLKFDHTAPGESRADEFRALAAPLGVTAATPVLVAGSTFEGEERLLAELLLALRPAFPDLILILVPRHVERTPAILRDLAGFNLRIVRRSTLPVGEPAACDILLVDSTGELRSWYELATVVFIGKSLTAIGGKNPAESVMLGKPTLFGPHMENFLSLVSHLLAIQAASQVPDAPALQSEVAALLGDPARRAVMGSRGRAALTSHQGATQRLAALLSQTA